MDTFAARAGAYVHMPFCSAVCPYCDFAVVAGRDDVMGRYCEAVGAEIGRDTPWREIDAVYFGGGTPSRVPAPLLSEIIKTISAIHGISPQAEITLEANPEDFSVPHAEAFVEAGFNRVSFGAQSFDGRVLMALGRRHRPEQIAESVANARIAGFENVSVDLIYGTPEESTRSWSLTLEHAAAAKPDHVSCYALTVEPGTELGRQVRAGASAPDPDIQADRFLKAEEILAGSGLTRYEVSNWSLPGKECIYNSIVWAQGEYVAYGNGGHRYRSGVRSRNIRRFDAYLKAVESGTSPIAGSEVIGGWDAEIDRLFVGLRRVAGVEMGVGGVVFLKSLPGQRLVEAGVVAEVSGRIQVEEPMLTDAVLRVVLDLEAPDSGEQRSDADNVRVEVFDA